MSFPGRVTKSHLSRIENGQAEPTFPRMFALSRIYGVPISSLAERFENDLSRTMMPDDIAGLTDEEIQARADEHSERSECEEALTLYDVVIERFRARGELERPAAHELRLRRVFCLNQIGRYGMARDEVEALLGSPMLSLKHRALAMTRFFWCCYGTNRFSIARMAMKPTEELIQQLPDEDPLRRSFDNMLGALHTALGEHTAAAEAFHRAMVAREKAGEHFNACRVRINYAEALLECGKTNESRRILILAHQQARKHGFDRNAAFALSTLGKLSYVTEDLDAAESYCLRSNAIARAREFLQVVFRNCYYLWHIARRRDDGVSITSNERTLKRLLNQVPDQLPEKVRYRRYLAGEHPGLGCSETETEGGGEA